MNRERDGASQYADSVLDTTRTYVQELLSENERLRLLTARLESEKERFMEEKLRIQERLLQAREDLEGYQAEHTRLQRRLLDVERESLRFSDQYAVVEQQNTNLANLYVASYRLHATLDRAAVLDCIQEIIINLVGSEELAILECRGEGASLEVASSFGLDWEAGSRVPIGDGVLAEALRRRAPVLVEDERLAAVGNEEHLTACVPLAVDGHLVGAILVYRLLQQKPGLEAVDRELFELLGTHAAVALHYTRLTAEARREVAVAG